MSESDEVSGEGHVQAERVSVIPEFFGIPAPSALLMVSGALLFGFEGGVAIVILHLLTRRWVYAGYRKIPWMHDFGMPDAFNQLLVKGLPGDFFARLDRAFADSGVAEVSVPGCEKYKTVVMSLNRYARQRGGMIEVIEGDAFGVVNVQGMIEGSSLDRGEIPSFGNLVSSQEQKNEREGRGLDHGEGCKTSQRPHLLAHRGKRKISLD